MFIIVIIINHEVSRHTGDGWHVAHRLGNVALYTSVWSEIFNSTEIKSFLYDYYLLSKSLSKCLTLSVYLKIAFNEKLPRGEGESFE